MLTNFTFYSATFQKSYFECFACCFIDLYLPEKNPVFPKMQFPHKIHTRIILKWFFTRMNSSILNFTWLLLTSFYLRILSNISFIPNLFYNSNLKKKNPNFFFKTCILITSDLKKLFTTTSIEYLFFLL